MPIGHGTRRGDRVSPKHGSDELVVRGKAPRTGLRQETTAQSTAPPASPGKPAAQAPQDDALREQRVVETIATLTAEADPDLDVTGQLYTVVAASVMLFDIDTAVVQMPGAGGALDTIATCSTGMAPVAPFTEGRDGPGQECFERGAVISSPDLDTDPWSPFSAQPGLSDSARCRRSRCGPTVESSAVWSCSGAPSGVWPPPIS